jgi:hypothetical protein
MSLEGNLTAFGLSEILQLIAVQRKSGMLTVTRQSSSMKLFFRDGRVVSTRDRRRGATDPFVDYLVRYGVISREEVSRLTDVSAQSKLDITDVIVSEGVLTAELLEFHCRNHVQETVHDVLTWEQCSYRFIPGPEVTAGMKVLVDVAVEGMLMESMRRIDEFPLILKEFPSGDIKVKRRAGAVRGDKIASREAVVFEMLSVERTIDDLVAHAKIPLFETYEALRQLKESNLIEAEERVPLEPEIEKTDAITKQPRSKRRRNLLPLFASAVVFVASGLWGSRNITPLFDRYTGGETAQNIRAKASLRERNEIEDQLRWYLEIYRAGNGTYPVELARLGETGVAPESFLQTVKDHALRYQLTQKGHRYILL